LFGAFSGVRQGRAVDGMTNEAGRGNERGQKGVIRKLNWPRGQFKKGLEAEMASARPFVLPARRDECVQPSTADPLR